MLNDESERLRHSITLALGRMMLQQIEMQQVIERQAAQLEAQRGVSDREKAPPPDEGGRG